jgi:hypothetical protein
MKAPRSRKGFYLVSPLLGIFFFLIAMGIAAFLVTENNQQIDTAKASDEHPIVFTSYALQSDVFDVYFQNYLQFLLDTYVVGSENSDALKTSIQDAVADAMATELRPTYTVIYEKEYNVTCTSEETGFSAIIMKINDPSVNLDILNSGRRFGNAQNGRPETAIWPYPSRYYLACEADEPPLDIETQFKSRWYYLDVSCICCQLPAICGLKYAYTEKPFLQCMPQCRYVPEMHAYLFNQP